MDPRRVTSARQSNDLTLCANVAIDVIPIANALQDRMLIDRVRRGAYRPGRFGIRLLRGHNIFTDVGLAVVAAALVSSSGNITHFGLGSSSTAAAASDTALVSEVSKPTITYVSSSAGVTTAQYYLGSGMLNGSTLREAGLWVGTSLLARYVFNDADFQPKTSAVAGVFTWTFTFARA